MKGSQDRKVAKILRGLYFLSLVAKYQRRNLVECIITSIENHFHILFIFLGEYNKKRNNIHAFTLYCRA